MYDSKLQIPDLIPFHDIKRHYAIKADELIKQILNFGSLTISEQAKSVNLINDYIARINYTENKSIFDIDDPVLAKIEYIVMFPEEFLPDTVCVAKCLSIIIDFKNYHMIYTPKKNEFFSISEKKYLEISEIVKKDKNFFIAWITLGIMFIRDKERNYNLPEHLKATSFPNFPKIQYEKGMYCLFRAINIHQDLSLAYLHLSYDFKDIGDISNQYILNQISNMFSGPHLQNVDYRILLKIYVCKDTSFSIGNWIALSRLFDTDNLNRIIHWVQLPLKFHLNYTLCGAGLSLYCLSQAFRFLYVHPMMSSERYNDFIHAYLQICLSISKLLSENSEMIIDPYTVFPDNDLECFPTTNPLQTLYFLKKIILYIHKRDQYTCVIFAEALFTLGKFCQQNRSIALDAELSELVNVDERGVVFACFEKAATFSRHHSYIYRELACEILLSKCMILDQVLSSYLRGVELDYKGHAFFALISAIRINENDYMAWHHLGRYFHEFKLYPGGNAASIKIPFDISQHYQKSAQYCLMKALSGNYYRTWWYLAIVTRECSNEILVKTESLGQNFNVFLPDKHHDRLIYCYIQAIIHSPDINSQWDVTVWDKLTLKWYNFSWKHLQVARHFKEAAVYCDKNFPDYTVSLNWLPSTPKLISKFFSFCNLALRNTSERGQNQAYSAFYPRIPCQLNDKLYWLSLVKESDLCTLSQYVKPTNEPGGRDSIYVNYKFKILPLTKRAHVFYKEAYYWIIRSELRVWLVFTSRNLFLPRDIFFHIAEYLCEGALTRGELQNLTVKMRYLILDKNPLLQQLDDYIGSFITAMSVTHRTRAISLRHECEQSNDREVLRLLLRQQKRLFDNPRKERDQAQSSWRVLSIFSSSQYNQKAHEEYLFEPVIKDGFYDCIVNNMARIG